MTAVTARLIPVISLYYPAFAARFGSDDEGLKFAAKEYADRLQFHGIDGKMFMAGIRELKAKGAEPFHPNPEQFALMCKQAAIESLNIPQFQAVLSDVIKGKQALRFGEAHAFIHSLNRVICSRKGDLMYELTGIEFEKVIKSEYDHWVKRLQAGEQLPEPQLAISHDKRPEMPAHLRMAPKSAMALRIEALRAEAAARKAQ
ncbi:MAG TPA: hypothetical protein DF774_02295 [Rheinheimera sp.]|uniref:replication protein P n=1 Tax=Rheinheimera sp. TaxID=1869214 RepID=UPI000EDC5338|nr:replication protein P [Rheinheimera sp.]HCU64571.1 hypothetical protein [Rheinheimera sp.]